MQFNLLRLGWIDKAFHGRFWRHLFGEARRATPTGWPKFVDIEASKASLKAGLSQIFKNY